LSCRYLWSKEITAKAFTISAEHAGTPLKTTVASAIPPSYQVSFY